MGNLDCGRGDEEPLIDAGVDWGGRKVLVSLDLWGSDAVLVVEARV